MSTEKTRLYVITDDELKLLIGIRKRLHSEVRMDGNEMRDLGHTIDAVIELAKKMEMDT